MIQESDLPQKGNGWKYEKNILIQKVTSGIRIDGYRELLVGSVVRTLCFYC